MRAIAVVGYKKSGKTTLAMELAQALKAQGHTVTLAKHSHHGFDEKPDTDTARFRDVADMVLGFSPGGSFVSWPGEKPLTDLVPLVGTDILVLEGGKTLGVMPRIIIAPDEATAGDLDPELALAAYGDVALEGVMATRDIAGLARIAANGGFLLPGLDCGGCGRPNCRALAAEIVAGDATEADCVAMNGALKININGQPLALNPFIERMLRGGILGMLRELKGFGPGPVDIQLG
ncbi:MAG: molybdopterin-guanine dinucleotide biosynthesis protein MobB [Humidesulfovibrio sp.]|uniref:molybdopterin-guanine dinucleotide biosynthesis protein MobB n=1 Tax=Humidesulfovibrio sp. TaxID=2910988 RepID=UPI0027E6B939|nr:molybdopterin-guanine dinucleotide biosynthesis protein MobB [Humidesulfovibrio sp.]MDQ7836690.1 molybdopterin-guanine dinucleotide biosynthesis protein MobB [Humidesulfovibrio sp.]